MIQALPSMYIILAVCFCVSQFYLYTSSFTPTARLNSVPKLSRTKAAWKCGPTIDLLATTHQICCNFCMESINRTKPHSLATCCFSQLSWQLHQKRGHTAFANHRTHVTPARQYIAVCLFKRIKCQLTVYRKKWPFKCN